MSSTVVKAKLHPTRNDLDESIRGELILSLNQALATLADLKLQFKQAHWNVRGMNFIELHNLFDTLSAEAEIFVDMLAERITALGGTALGTIELLTKETKLSAYPVDIHDGKDHLTALAKNLSIACQQVRQASDQAAERGDADTADLFTEISRAFDKNLWFIEAHIQ